MVPGGTTGTFAPLALTPNGVPPVGTVYQLMEAPVVVAFNCTVAPGHATEGVTVTGVGAGRERVTVTGTLLTETNPLQDDNTSA